MIQLAPLLSTILYPDSYRWQFTSDLLAIKVLEGLRSHSGLAAVCGRLQSRILTRSRADGQSDELLRNQPRWYWSIDDPNATKGVVFRTLYEDENPIAGVNTTTPKDLIDKENHAHFEPSLHES